MGGAPLPVVLVAIAVAVLATLAISDVLPTWARSLSRFDHAARGVVVGLLGAIVGFAMWLIW